MTCSAHSDREVPLKSSALLLLLSIVGLLCFLALPALAQTPALVPTPVETYPILSPERASVAAIFGREFVTGTSSADPVTGLRAEWKAGVAAAYNLIAPSTTNPGLPHISLNGRAVIGLDSKQITPSIYLVWRVWSGKDGAK